MSDERFCSSPRRKITFMKKSTARRIFGAVFVGLATLSAVSAQSITSFDATPTATGTFPAGINLGGTIDGEYLDANGSHGFLRAPNGTINTFDPPNSGTGTTTVLSHSMNNLGAVVGFYYAGGLAGTNGTGFMRDPSGNFTNVAPPGSTDTQVQLSINDVGQIAGSYFAANAWHGFVFAPPYTAYTSFEVSGALEGIIIGSINNSGEVAGSYTDSTGHLHGFVYNSSTAAVTTFSAPAPNTDLEVSAINDNGVVTGFVETCTISGFTKNCPTFEGFVRQGTTITLFTAASQPLTQGEDINLSGTITGYDCSAGFAVCNGFVRSPAGVITALNVLGAADTEPQGVNALGTVAGIWLDESFTRHGFVATFPAAGPPPSGVGCNGTYNATFMGDLIVLPGQTCNFSGGQINGNVTLLGGTFGVSGATVHGSVAIAGEGTFSVGPSTIITGDLTVALLFAPPSTNQICGTTIRGSVNFEGNDTAVVIGQGTLSCPGNTVGGSVTIIGNAASVIVDGNTITDSLNCAGNRTIAGSGNTAAHKLGQCALF
jgi:hypothetical protein